MGRRILAARSRRRTVLGSSGPRPPNAHGWSSTNSDGSLDLRPSRRREAVIPDMPTPSDRTSAANGRNDEALPMRSVLLRLANSPGRRLRPPGSAAAPVRDASRSDVTPSPNACPLRSLTLPAFAKFFFDVEQRTEFVAGGFVEYVSVLASRFRQHPPRIIGVAEYPLEECTPFAVVENFAASSRPFLVHRAAATDRRSSPFHVRRLRHARATSPAFSRAIPFVTGAIPSPHIFFFVRVVVGEANGNHLVHRFRFLVGFVVPNPFALRMPPISHSSATSSEASAGARHRHRAFRRPVPLPWAEELPVLPFIRSLSSLLASSANVRGVTLPSSSSNQTERCVLRDASPSW